MFKRLLWLANIVASKILLYLISGLNLVICNVTMKKPALLLFRKSLVLWQTIFYYIVFGIFITLLLCLKMVRITYNRSYKSFSDRQYTIAYGRDPQPMVCGSVPGCSLLGIGLWKWWASAHTLSCICESGACAKPSLLPSLPLPVHQTRKVGGCWPIEYHQTCRSLIFLDYQNV